MVCRLAVGFPEIVRNRIVLLFPPFTRWLPRALPPLCPQRLRTTYSLDSPAVQAATHAAVTAAMEASNGVAGMVGLGGGPGSSRRPARAAAAGAAAAARAAAEAAGTPVGRRASGGLGRTSSSGGMPLSLLPMSPDDDSAVVTPGVGPQVVFGGCDLCCLI